MCCHPDKPPHILSCSLNINISWSFGISVASGDILVINHYFITSLNIPMTYPLVLEYKEWRFPQVVDLWCRSWGRRAGGCRRCSSLSCSGLCPLSSVGWSTCLNKTIHSTLRTRPPLECKIYICWSSLMISVTRLRDLIWEMNLHTGCFFFHWASPQKFEVQKSWSRLG